MSVIHMTAELGQSIWLDYIRRDLIQNGELLRLIEEDGIRGVTSNPSIFQSAIAGSDLYSADIRRLSQADWDAERIFDRIAIDDIRGATDVFLPLYERTNGLDGYVSIEVNPELANDGDATLREARRIWDEINRPNVMIKIPATRAGIPAIEAAIDSGINVNVTLIFSLERYAEVMEAYLRGLESRVDRGEAIDHIASVASFFISRVDSAVDKVLEAIVERGGAETERASSLMGKAAIANAKLAYAQFEGIFYTERFERLQAVGARYQRPLWASTSTKNPSYPDTYYVDTLIGPHTVNTMPQQTIDAFIDHGVAQSTVGTDISGARAQIQAIEALGISMADVTEDLERDGVEKFAAAYAGLLETLEERALTFREELSPFLPGLKANLERLEAEKVASRLWKHDATLWTTKNSEMEEVVNRLGWLDLPRTMKPHLFAISEYARALRERGVKTAILMGMGGSSLAADVFRRTLGDPTTFNLIVLDTTDPEIIRKAAQGLDYKHSVFLVASKSGGTVEPLRMLEYFWGEAREALEEKVGEHFIALTDSGSPLEALAKERNFDRIINTPEDVGGRYSALTPFGLFPAALQNLDLEAILSGADRVAAASGPQVPNAANPGMYLGAVLAASYHAGRDKVTFVSDSELEPFVDWIEQLLAESSGKDGKGMTPIAAEPVGAGKVYGSDRFVVYLRSQGGLDRRLSGWRKAGLPVLVLDMLPQEESLGGAFYQWEFGVAIACHLLGVNAFNQPDVQSAKSATVDVLKRYEKKGVLPMAEVLWEDDSLRLRGEPSWLGVNRASLDEFVEDILTSASSMGGVGFLLYLPQKSAIEKTLARTRRVIRDQMGLATLHGFGPRYLHSTGQLHKGGRDHAVYLVVTSDRKTDLGIPGFEYGFATLQEAQAVGDVQALIRAGRKAFHVQLKDLKHLGGFFTLMETSAQRLSG